MAVEREEDTSSSFDEGEGKGKLKPKNDIPDHGFTGSIAGSLNTHTDGYRSGCVESPHT